MVFFIEAGGLNYCLDYDHINHIEKDLYIRDQWKKYGNFEIRIQWCLLADIENCCQNESLVVPR